MDNLTLYIIGQVVTVIACVAVNKTDIHWIKKAIDEIKADLKGGVYVGKRG